MSDTKFLFDRFAAFNAPMRLLEIVAPFLKTVEGVMPDDWVPCIYTNTKSELSVRWFGERTAMDIFIEAHRGEQNVNRWLRFVGDNRVVLLNPTTEDLKLFFEAFRSGSDQPFKELIEGAPKIPTSKEDAFFVDHTTAFLEERRAMII